MTKETALIADLQDLGRSLISVADRNGKDTNWDAFGKRAREIVERAWKHLHEVGYYDEMAAIRQRMLDESAS